MTTPARAHTSERGRGAPAPALLIALFALLAVLAMPAAAFAASITAYVGGDRTGNNADTAFTSTVTPVTFEYRNLDTNGPWQDLCQVTGTSQSCTGSAPANNTEYAVRVKESPVPAGWRALRQISYNGGNAEAGPTLPYESIVETGGSTSTVTASPNRISAGNESTTSTGVTRFHMLARDNPPLPQACSPFNVVMSMDISSSINTAGGGFTGQQKRQGMAAGAKALVDGLAGANVTLRLDTFGSGVSQGGTLYNLNNAADRTAAKAAIDSVYQPTVANPTWATNYTNWDSALTTARNRTDTAVVVLLTDGNPTRDASGTQDSTVRQRAISYAIASANSVKGAGKRVIAVGAGAGVTSVNLAAISGPVADSDYFVGDFDALEVQLKGIAAQLCGAKVNVRKYVSDRSTDPAADWQFTAAAANPADGLTITGTNGGVTAGAPAETVFSIGNLPSAGTRTVRIDETLQADHSFGNAVCREGSYPSYADVTGAPQDTRVQSIALAREEEWFCTYVNTRDTGSLTVTKAVTGDVPAGFSQDFTVDITCSKQGEPAIAFTDETLTHPGAGLTRTGIPTGYRCTVTEQTPTPVTDHTWGTPDITPATVTITKDQTATVNVTNPLARDTGRLEVIKHLAPADDPGRFDLSAAGPTPLSATGVGHAGTTGAGGTEVATGTYTISETAVAGTDLGDYAAVTVCHDRADADRTPINTGTDVTVGRGDDIVCVVTNTRGAAAVTVTKTVIGHAAGDTTSFPISLTGEAGFSLAHGGTGTFTVASRRPLTLEEDMLPAGYAFDTIACEVGGNPVGTTTGRAITFTPDTGETVECTVTNVRLPSLTVVKRLTGDGAAGDTTAFPFTVGGAPAFTLANGASEVLTLPVGSHTVSEGALPTGYRFVSAECVVNGAPAGTGRSITVTLAAGDTAECTYVNARPETPVTPPTPPAPPAPPVTPPAPPVTPGGGGTTGGRTTATPTLAITKVGPTRARGLQRITYTIRVRNTGTVPARSVVLTDRLPRDLAFIRSSLRGVFRAGSIRIELGTIAPGRAKVVRIIVRAPANTRGVRVNVAQVSATDVTPRTARARTVFTPIRRIVTPSVTG